ncbi:MAG: hypothetical protein JNM75_14055 [Rhodospirillales bacterium]|nr:hypothetical protein [Rhodospirillales bacterium]
MERSQQATCGGEALAPPGGQASLQHTRTTPLERSDNRRRATARRWSITPIPNKSTLANALQTASFFIEFRR